MSPALFDPLLCLENELRANVGLAPDGKVKLRFEKGTSPETTKRAWSVVKAYEKLLALQLEEGHASVQKLIAHGKIKIVSGKYIRR